MREKWLYFRREATIGDDDGTGNSACFPASSLMGMEPSSDTLLKIYFKPITRRDPTGSVDHANSLDNHDSVELTIPNNTHITAMKAIATVVSGDNFPSFIVVADNKSGATEYLTGSGITSCGAIAVGGVYTNS